ncbi:MAG TPA: ABC transporter substrate-binding protein, partial [Methylomirabilota bacterium]
MSEHTRGQWSGPVSRRTFMAATGAAAAVSGFPAFLRAQAREVKVGYLLPVTGPLAFEAALALNGLTLAAEEINAGGGVKSLGGARISLLSGDTQNKVELGNSEASRLIDQGAVAIIGPFSSLVAF